MAQDLRTGQGWRVGWRSESESFPALVGSDHWAVELTAAEFQAFTALLAQLTQQLQAMSSELMPDEAIALTASNEQIHLELDGYPHAYGLHLIVLQGRRAEGEWPAPVSADFLLACAELAATLKCPNAQS
ncbi:DUF1818 family protein [Parathermosynechococcus lividus]